jgi:hypothetical protein
MAGRGGSATFSALPRHPVRPDEGGAFGLGLAALHGPVLPGRPTAAGSPIGTRWYPLTDAQRAARNVCRGPTMQEAS